MVIPVGRAEARSGGAAPGSASLAKYLRETGEQLEEVRARLGTEE